MAKTENQKRKLLLLQAYLTEHTDENHPVSMQKLLSHLAENGVIAERKSVYDDLDALRESGMDILRAGGANGGYYLASREFELAELKLLTDAVQSSKFLSERKSLELISKLETLCSNYEARALRRQVVVAGRVKTMNESIYYNVDQLHEAIAANSRIRFRYFEWTPDRQRLYRPGQREASPLALCWSDENYYLIAHTQEHGITHFRVDKMSAITATGQARTVTPETERLNPADYGKQVFSMYGGEKTSVRLRFENDLAGVVFDRFGRDVMLIPDGTAHFLFTAEVRISPMFLSWLVCFGNRVKILSPQSVADDFCALCDHATEQYSL